MMDKFKEFKEIKNTMPKMLKFAVDVVCPFQTVARVLNSCKQ